MAGTINTLATVFMNQTGNVTTTSQVATRAFRVVDVKATVNVGNTTVAVQRTALGGGTASIVTVAIPTPTTDRIVQALTVVSAQAAFAIGDTVVLTGGGATVNADIFLNIIPTGITG